MSDHAVRKYESDLARLTREADAASAAAGEARLKLERFIANRDVHIAYNRAVEEVRGGQGQFVQARYIDGWESFT